MDIAIALTWTAIIVLALALSVRVIRWLRRGPNKQDLALGDLLAMEEPLDVIISKLMANARQAAIRYFRNTVGITVLLEIASTLVLLAQHSTPGSRVLIVNAVLWCCFGIVMYASLMAQLYVGLRKAKRMLTTQRPSI